MKFFNMVLQSGKSPTSLGNMGFLGLLGLFQNENVLNFVQSLFGDNADVMAIFAGIIAVFNIFRRTKITKPLSEL